MPLLLQNYQAGCLNFYRGENYKPGVMSISSKGTASPNSQPSARPTYIMMPTKMKSMKRDL